MNRINSTNNKDNLLIKRSDLVKEWDYDKNDVIPQKIGIGYTKKVWFKCHICRCEWKGFKRSAACEHFKVSWRNTRHQILCA